MKIISPFSQISLAAILASPLTGCAQNVGTSTIATNAALPVSANISANSAQSPSAYRRLRDIFVFDKEKLGQWAGSGNGAKIEVVTGDTLPIDEAQSYESRPSLRVAATSDAAANGGWWQVKCAGESWATYDLHNYYDRGLLQFSIKGEKGGEHFKVALETKAAAGKGAEVSSTRFFKVTGDWQKVSIPLSALFDKTKKNSLRQTWLVNFASADGKPLKFWLNNVRFSTTDGEPGFPAIKVNQLGYTRKAPKYAIVSGFPEELKVPNGAAFQVVNAKNSDVAFSGKLQQLSAFDEKVSGERVLRADFSGLQTSGEYKVRVAGQSDSPTFRIGDDVYRKFLVDTSRYFYLQRSGFALDARHAGIFARKLGHLGDARLTLQSEPNGPQRDVSGGWYDAGDYGKYVSMCALPICDLLTAYETFPTQFKDDQFNIPESGNGVPDILDEARWELNWVLKMQDARSGGFYQEVWPNNSDQMPAEDTTKRFIYDQANGQNNVRATATTANAVAALASAAFTFKNVDIEYSKKLLGAAQRGWAYLEANPKDIVVTGMTGADTDDRDNRQWAAAAMLRTTGEAKYRAYFDAHYAQFTKYWQSKDDNAYGEDLSMLGMLLYMKTPNRDPKIAAWFRGQFNTWRATQMARWKGNIWSNFLDETDYYWGSNCAILQTNLLMTIGSKLLGTYDQQVIDAVRANVNYILGVNPMRFSYVSGYGADSVKNIYSHIWTHDGIQGIPPGYMAGGANRYQGRAFSNFSAKCYSDVDSEWTTNENAIYWNSVLVFNAALLNQEAKS